MLDGRELGKSPADSSICMEAHSRFHQNDLALVAAHRFAIARERLAQAGAPGIAGVEALLQPVEKASLRAVVGIDARPVGATKIALPCRSGLPVSEAKILPIVHSPGDTIAAARQLLIGA